MGQYFQLIATERSEFASPWDLGGIAKLWEWVVNRQSNVIPYLLVCPELAGKPSVNKMLGRWANSPVALVGDYDDDSTFYEGCTSLQDALNYGQTFRLKDAVASDNFIFADALMRAGLPQATVRVKPKGKDSRRDLRPGREVIVNIPPEATDAQVFTFLRAIESKVDYANITVLSTEQGPHGPNLREFSVRRPWRAEGEGEAPLQEAVKLVVINENLSFQIAREYNVCAAPWTGEMLMAGYGANETPTHLNEAKSKGQKRGRLVESAEARVKAMLPLSLVPVNHTKKQVILPATLGIAGGIRDWCKCGWAGLFPFLLRKSVGDGGGDGMSGDTVAGMWAMDEIELRPEAPEGYEDIAPLVGGRFNQYVEIKEYYFPMRKGLPKVSTEGDTCPPTLVIDASSPESLAAGLVDGASREGVKK